MSRTLHLLHSRDEPDTRMLRSPGRLLYVDGLGVGVLLGLIRHGVDRVELWSAEALTWSRWLPRGLPVDFHVVAPPSSALAGGLSRLAFERDVRVTCLFEPWTRALKRHGVDAETRRPRPPSRRNDRRSTLRGSMGIDDKQRLVLVPGAALPGGPHCEAVWTITLLHVLRPEIRALLDFSGSAAGELRHFVRDIDRPRLAVDASRHAAELLELADAVLVGPGRRHPWCALSKLQVADCPVIVAPQPTLDVIRDVVPGAITPQSNETRDLARSLLEAVEGVTSLPTSAGP